MRFYERIPRSYWAIISGLFGFIFIITALLLHSISEPISFFTHWVSHLGWGPNGAELVFKVGLIILGCLITPYFIFLYRYLRGLEGGENKKLINKSTQGAIFASGVALIALIITALFGNINQNGFYLHLIGAVTYFMTGMIAMVLFTLSMFLSKKYSKIQVIWTIITLGIFIAMLISAIPLISTYSITDLLMINEAVLDKISPLTRWLTFFEWQLVFSTFIWFIITGVYTLKQIDLKFH